MKALMTGDKTPFQQIRETLEQQTVGQGIRNTFIYVKDSFTINDRELLEQYCLKNNYELSVYVNGFVAYITVNF
jgi:hypothetical protein